MTSGWRFFKTGHTDGPRNMAVDEALLRSVKVDGGGALLRLYGWKPAAVSVGYHQDVLRDMDVARCTQDHIRIVRRLTGGRAVLHDEEVTYSVIAPEDDPVIGHTISETYERIGTGLVAALRHLGVRAALEKGSAGRGKNPSCFSSTGRHEIVYQGRKLVGSAQRRMGGMILQHGSLLTGPAYRKLMDLLRPESLPLPRHSSENVVTLSEILGSVPSYDSICEALRIGFEQAFGIRLVQEDLTAEELALAEKLRTERYETDEWNLRRPTCHADAWRTRATSQANNTL